MKSNIRNFVIIAHIDHGKSTLADRLLEITGTVSAHKMQAQYLDSNELERERGITIKMAPVRMIYRPSDIEKSLAGQAKIPGRAGKNQNDGTGSILNFDSYILNLIDTPGHSDFGYEVSRSLKAVEGAILLVDVTQGIQAQTLANFELAKKAGLKIIGALNKVDVNPAGMDEMAIQLSELIGCQPSEIHRVSGRTGQGVPELLKAVIEDVPPPKDTGKLSALIFSSKYDNHKGVVAFVRIFGGQFKAQDTTRLMATNHEFKIKEVGYFSPELSPSPALLPGDIGYIATGIKDPDFIKIGDTAGVELMPGFKIPDPVVFVSIYPNDSSNYDDLKSAMGKLRLSDSALVFTADFSEVLGRGFRCGFLGRLHFEITMQRLEREFSLDVVNSFPSVSYRVYPAPNAKNIPKEKIVSDPPAGEAGGDFVVESPQDLPADYLEVKEPMTRIEVLMPAIYLGPFLGMKNAFRISDVETESYGTDRVLVRAKLPLSDLILDFDDRLKSLSSGFASFNYEIVGFEKTKVKRLDIHVAEEPVMGLSRIIYEEDVESEGRKMILRLKDLLPQQQFAQALQAVIGGKIIARETIPAAHKELGDFGKNGGDRTRKMKLWKKQKEGKVRLKERGRGQVEVSADIFKELLKK